jgi:hypothetical protein
VLYASAPPVIAREELQLGGPGTEADMEAFKRALQKRMPLNAQRQAVQIKFRA